MTFSFTAELIDMPWSSLDFSFIARPRASFAAEDAAPFLHADRFLGHIGRRGYIQCATATRSCLIGTIPHHKYAFWASARFTITVRRYFPSSASRLPPLRRVYLCCRPFSQFHRHCLLFIRHTGCDALVTDRMYEFPTGPFSGTIMLGIYRYAIFSARLSLPSKLSRLLYDVSSN